MDEVLVNFPYENHKKPNSSDEINEKDELQHQPPKKKEDKIIHQSFSLSFRNKDELDVRRFETPRFHLGSEMELRKSEKPPLVFKEKIPSLKEIKPIKRGMSSTNPADLAVSPRKFPVKVFLKTNFMDKTQHKTFHVPENLKPYAVTAMKEFMDLEKTAAAWKAERIKSMDKSEGLDMFNHDLPIVNVSVPLDDEETIAAFIEDW